MKCKAAILIIAALYLLMLGLAACNTEPPVESTADTTEPIDAVSLYEEARAKLSSATDLLIKYDLHEERIINEDTYLKEISGTDSYCRVDAKNMECVVQQALTYGTYKTEYTELFIDGTAYTTVNGSSFSCEMDAETFRSRQIPRILLDSSLYGSITALSDGGTYLLTFTDATAPESWAVPFESVQLLSAGGNAVLDSNSNILHYSYMITYIHNGVTYEFGLDTWLTTPDHLDLSATRPALPDSPTPITDLDAPKYLLQAVGDLFTTQSFSAEISQTLSSKMYGLTQSQQSQLYLHGTGNELTALMQLQLTATDYRGTPAISAQTDHYKDGTLTQTTDDSAPVKSAATPEDIRMKWENHILNGFFALTYLSDAKITEKDNLRTLEFSGNDAFCDAVVTSFHSVLPNDLDTIADSFETTIAGGYLTFDRNTALPVAMGMEFERSHEIFGITYPLSYTLHQTLTLSSEDAHSAIDAVG